MPPVCPGVCHEYSCTRREASERGGERRQQLFDVASRRGLDPAADERCSVLERPDELVDLLHHFERQRCDDTRALGHQEDRDACRCVRGCSCNSAFAFAWVHSSSSPSVQSIRTAWIAASDVTTDMPSSAEIASTTSRSRARMSRPAHTRRDLPPCRRVVRRPRRARECASVRISLRACHSPRSWRRARRPMTVENRLDPSASSA